LSVSKTCVDGVRNTINDLEKPKLTINKKTPKNFKFNLLIRNNSYLGKDCVGEEIDVSSKVKNNIGCKGYDTVDDVVLNSGQA